MKWSGAVGLVFVVILSSSAYAGERRFHLAQRSEPDRQICFMRCESTSVKCTNDCEDRLGGGIPGTTRKQDELVQCRIACNASYGACSRGCN